MRVHKEYHLCRHCQNASGQRQIPFVEFLQKYRADQCPCDQCDGLCHVHPTVISENIFAVIRQYSSHKCLVHTGDSPEDQRCPEINISHKSLYIFTEGRLRCFFLYFNMYVFFTICKTDKQHDKRDHTPQHHGFHPGCLCISE